MNFLPSVVLMLVFAPATASAAEVRLVDLTNIPPATRRIPLSEIGTVHMAGVAGGNGAAAGKPRFQLELALPKTHFEKDEEFTYEVIIRNTSGVSVRVPVATSLDTIFAPPLKNSYVYDSISIDLRLNVSQGPQVIEGRASLFGAPTDPSMWVELKDEDSIRIRAKTKFSFSSAATNGKNKSDAHKDTIPSLQAQARFTEVRLQKAPGSNTYDSETAERLTITATPISISASLAH